MHINPVRWIIEDTGHRIDKIRRDGVDAFILYAPDGEILRELESFLDAIEYLDRILK